MLAIGVSGCSGTATLSEGEEFICDVVAENWEYVSLSDVLEAQRQIESGSPMQVLLNGQSFLNMKQNAQLASSLEPYFSQIHSSRASFKTSLENMVSDYGALYSMAELLAVSKSDIDKKYGFLKKTLESAESLKSQAKQSCVTFKNQ